MVKPYIQHSIINLCLSVQNSKYRITNDSIDTCLHNDNNNPTILFEKIFSPPPNSNQRKTEGEGLRAHEDTSSHFLSLPLNSFTSFLSWWKWPPCASPCGNVHIWHIQSVGQSIGNMRQAHHQAVVEDNDDLQLDIEQTFRVVDDLQTVGINVSDIKKLQEAGLSTIGQVLQSCSRTLLSIKGFSEGWMYPTLPDCFKVVRTAKVEKIREAARWVDGTVLAASHNNQPVSENWTLVVGHSKLVLRWKKDESVLYTSRQAWSCISWCDCNHRVLQDQMPWIRYWAMVWRQHLSRSSLENFERERLR